MAMSAKAKNAHRRQARYVLACRWVMSALILAGLGLFLAGYPLLTWIAIVVALLCPALCLLLYWQSRDTQEQVAAAVEEAKGRLPSVDTPPGHLVEGRER